MLREDKIKPLSFTQISLYQTCPLSYKLRYIDGLKPKDKWYFSFGTTLHSCVEFFFRVNAPVPPTLDDFLAYYTQNWLSQGYESAEEEEGYKESGKKILTEFWKIHSADFQLPVALEKRFFVDIEGIKLMGFIDRVDKLESGGLSIIDYKSNKELFTNDYLEDDLQLTIYQLAAEQTWPLPVEKLTLYHLRSNTPCSCSPRGLARLDKARQLILEVADNILSEKFPAVENQFCPCDFPEHCPYYRHLYMEPAAARQDLLPGIAAAEAVERYSSLKAQINELETQLEEANQVITDFCQAEGLNRIYGEEHEITYRLIERTGFDADDVRVLLEPKGLWEKVLGLDQSRVRQLLTDKEISREIRAKLESLKRVTGTHSQLQVKKRIADEE